jgi:excinuclease UvrABC nuclease subunit
MIQITVPKFDYEVEIKDLSKIPYGVPGVYILYSEDDTVWYVGKASDIRNRVGTHYRGTTNTENYRWNISRCRAFKEENKTNRSIYELYLIEKFKPPLNISHNTDSFKGSRCLIKKKDEGELHPAFCQFTLVTGKQCSRRPRENGYCHLHGGKQKGVIK